jgi:hypothetical protein
LPLAEPFGCNRNHLIYSITTNQAAIIALFRVVNRYVGNLPPLPGVFSDYPAPVIGPEAGQRADGAALATSELTARVNKGAAIAAVTTIGPRWCR